MKNSKIKKLLSLLLVLVMLVGMIPTTSLPAFAAKDVFATSVTGVDLIGGEYFYYNTGSKGYTIPVENVMAVSGSSKVDVDGFTKNGHLYSNEACTYRLTEEPVLDETYYFVLYFNLGDSTNNITDSNSTITVDGFYNGKVVSATATAEGEYTVICSVKYGELTGGVKAIASGVEYDSTLGGYAPNFTTLKAVSTEGKELERTVVDGISYYGAKSGCLYKTNLGTSFSDKLTTEPQEGETYYSYFLLDSIDGNLNIKEKLVDIQIPGYDVKYLDSYERDGGFTSLVVYSVTKESSLPKLIGVKVECSGFRSSMIWDDYLGGYDPVPIYSPEYESAYVISEGNNYIKYVSKGSFYIDPDCTTQLKEEPKTGITYYFSITYNFKYGAYADAIRDEYSYIYIEGFTNGKVVKTIANNDTIEIICSVTATDAMDDNVYDIFVAGVGMQDGDYLAVGATATTKTEPSCGYAYYSDSKLILNNFSYEGPGYCYDKGDDYYACIAYNEHDWLDVELIGDNSLIQVNSNSEAIYSKYSSVGIHGTGSLFASGTASGIDAMLIRIQSGKIVAEGRTYGLRARGFGVDIYGGDVTAISENRAISAYEQFEVREGMEVTASTAIDGELGEYVAANHNSYKKIVVSVSNVYVGGVGMFDGDYLAVGATKTQTTKPSGGYAYYKDGSLTLDNYSYEGKGYEYFASTGQCAIIYTNKGLKIILMGDNTLVQTEENADHCICIDDIISDKNNNCLTIEGTGSLTCTTNDKDGEAISTPRGIIINSGTVVITKSCYGFYNNQNDIIINGGTIDVSSAKRGISAAKGNIIINGGSITVNGEQGIRSYAGSVIVNDGEVTAMGSDRSIAYATSFTVGDGMCILASTTADGALGKYVAENNDSYKKIVVCAGAIVSGTVTSFNSDTDDITIELFAEGSTSAYYTVTVKGNTTSYSFPAVPYGEYVIVAEKLGHVPYQCTIVAEDDALYQNVELNLYADTNLDGVIDVQDYQALINTVLADDHEQIETEEYDDLIHYDLVMDGYLDVLDAAVMALVVNGLKTIDEVYDIKKGDYDYDGEAYTESDLIAMYHVLSDIDSSAPTLSTSQKFASDLNYNGKVDEGDLAILTGRYGTIESTTCEDNVS